jgi:hypothetical protein
MEGKVLVSCGALLAIDLKGRSVVISFFKEERRTRTGGKREVVIGEGRHYHWLEANVEVHDLNEGDIWMICMRLSYRCFGDGACDSRGKAASMVVLVLFCCQ